MYPNGPAGPGGPGGSDSKDDAAQERRGAAQRFRDTDLPLAELWIYYYGIGGDIDEVSLDAYLNEAIDLPAAQAGLISTAMTEIIEGRQQ